MLVVVLLSFMVAVAAVRALASDAARAIALDRPNERSLHVRPTPRLGGVGLLIGACAGWIAGANPVAVIVAFPLFLLVAVSLTDDLVGLTALARLIVQIAAALVLLALGPPAPAWLWPPLVVTIVWSSNLFNFMDGSDGLAGGMAALGFATYAVVAGMAGDAAMATAAAALAAAAAGFLVWNFHPARIFMGDVGSVPMGFLAAALGTLGVLRGSWGAWLPFLVFSPFLVDATVTLGRRLRRGEKVWQAHRTHYYQRVIQMGAGHRATALGAYAIMALAGLSAVAGHGRATWVIALIGAAWAGAYLALARRIDAAWASHGSQGLEPAQARQP